LFSGRAAFWQTSISTRFMLLLAIFAGCRCPHFKRDILTFRWRDSAHQNEQKLLTLSLDEFLRRFLLHVLPKGFVRIRNFGFLANRRRATLLPLCFHLLGSAPQTEQDISGSKDSSDLWRCPKCGGPMKVIERLSAAEIQLRSPPALVTAAA
jgi:Putative transposase